MSNDRHIENIVIGKPIIGLWQLLGEPEDHASFTDTTVFDAERYLPRLLAKYGIMKSTSEVRRNRPDLIRTLDKLECFDLKIGKKKLYIIVGVDTLEELNKIIEESKKD